MNQEDRYLKDLLAGREPEKRIFISMTDKKEKPKGTIESELTKIMSEVRMPWFCSECKKVMKSRLDDKMWKLFGHCFDCQQQFEHELRTTGKYELWEKKKYYKNRRSALLDHADSIKDWLNQGDLEIVEPVNIDSGFVHIDKHKVPEKMKEEARDALKNLDNTLSSVDKILEELEIELDA